MCYNAEIATRKLIHYARLRGDEAYAAQLEAWLRDLLATQGPVYFTNGFAFPKLIAFTSESPIKPVDMDWGFIPHYVKNAAGIKQHVKLNAKSETMFKLDVFKKSAEERRCLLYFDAFYEYHTQGKIKYPFRIAMREDVPMVMGGIWREWVDQDTGEVRRTAAIVTTEANPMMAKIHNQPAASDTPRMPVILSKENQDEWLLPIKGDADRMRIMDLCKPFDEKLMEAHTVRRPTGKEGVGNKPEVREHFVYPDLAVIL